MKSVLSFLSLNPSNRHGIGPAVVLLMLFPALVSPLVGQDIAYEWSRQLDLSINFSAPRRALRMDDAGNTYIFTGYNGTPDVDPGPGEFVLPAGTTSVLIAKYDPTGSLVWANSLASGSTFGFGISDLVIDEAMERLAVVGTYTGQVDIDPGPGIVVLQPSTTSSCWKSFVALYDLNGNYLDHMTLGVN